MNRFVSLLIINLVAGSLVGIAVFWTLYNTAFEQMSLQLITTVESQKEIMASVAEFDEQYSRDVPGGARQATLSQFEKAHKRFNSFGETGEFTVAERDGPNFNFIFRQRNSLTVKPDSIPFESELAEPMRRALNDESGIIIALDYRGQEVLAAYAPVQALQVGIVAKLDMDEIRKPFIEAAIIGVLSALILFAASSALFMRAASPIGQELKESERLYRNLIEGQRELVCRSKMDGTLSFANDAYLAYFGKTLNELVGTNFSKLIPQEQREDALEQISQLSPTHRSVTHEHQVIASSGETRWMQWTVSLLLSDNGDAHEIISVGLDITERKNSQLAFDRVNRAQAVLLATHEVIIGENNTDKLLKACCCLLVEVGGYSLVWVGRAENDPEKTVTPVCSCGEGREYVDEITVTWDESPSGVGPSGTAIRTGKSVAFQHLDRDPDFEAFRVPALTHGYRSVVAVPMKVDSQVLGVLNVYSSEPNGFDDEEVGLLENLANNISFALHAIEQEKLKETAQTAVKIGRAQLKESLFSTITALAHTIEQRDPYTTGHQEQVADLAVAIATKMGLAEDVIDGIRMGSIVHDIGKISVPAEILNKPGRLTETEFELIKTHPENGYEIVKGIKFDWPIDKMIVQHHERLDGSGYPKGLKGDEICLEARIIAVADVVDAITSHRPYRPGKGVDFALNEIITKRGTFFDPDAVDACVSLIKNDGYVPGGPKD